jgi:hypothetical protein
VSYAGHGLLRPESFLQEIRLHVICVQILRLLYDARSRRATWRQLLRLLLHTSGLQVLPLRQFFCERKSRLRERTCRGIVAACRTYAELVDQGKQPNGLVAINGPEKMDDSAKISPGSAVFSPGHFDRSGTAFPRINGTDCLRYPRSRAVGASRNEGPRSQRIYSNYATMYPI